MRIHALYCLIILLSASSLALAQTDPCVPTPTSLCLNNDRFQVEVDWFTESGNSSTVGDFTGSGAARNTPISDVWTGMWFFDPDNLDLLIHVFEGCQFNNNFWVFSAGLTNVEVTLTVTDTQTGDVETWDNPMGMPFAPITDTEAFATCPPGQRQAATAPSGAEKLKQNAKTNAVEGDCVADATTVCLHNGRFGLSVTSQSADSPAQQLAGATAGFPFSNPTFFDLLVTINDGSSANGKYWVTYSMFEPLNFELTVKDHVTDESKIYAHTSNDPLIIQDQEAFTGDNTPTIDGTMSGSWFGPERDGEGFIFDVAVLNGVPTLVLYYFTYENNDSGRQAWMVGSAPIIGNKASVPVIIAEGAQFGVEFDPDDVTRTDWGNVMVTVYDCENALIESDSPFFPSIRYDLVRITPSPTGVKGVCESTEAIPADTEIDGGYSGSWFLPSRNGEGFIFNVAVIGGVNTLVVFYFTYENNESGRQAWLVGSAPIVGNSADVPVIITSGAQFGDAFDPDDVLRTPWGNIKVIWQSCNLANIEITSPLYEDINFDLIPLTPPTMGATGPCAN